MFSSWNFVERKKKKRENEQLFLFPPETHQNERKKNFFLTSPDAAARRRLLRHRPRQELELVVEQRRHDLGRLRRGREALADQRVGSDVVDVGVLVLKRRRRRFGFGRGSSSDGVPHAPGVSLGLPVRHSCRRRGGPRGLARRGGLGARRLAARPQALEVRAELVARPATAAASEAARRRDAPHVLLR